MRLGGSSQESTPAGRHLPGGEAQAWDDPPGPGAEPAYAALLRQARDPGQAVGGYEQAEDDPPPLPGQAELLAACLTPHQPVDIVLRLDLMHDLIDVRPSLLHHRDAQGRLVLAQPERPVLASQTGQPCEITFLHRQVSHRQVFWRRLGFQAPLLEIIPDYQVAPGYRAPVLIFPAPQALEPSSLRLFYRVQPPRDLGLKLWLLPERQELELLDLSAGGASFRHPLGRRFPPGSQIFLLLGLADFQLRLDARLVRQGEGLPEAGGAASLVAVSFADLDPGARQRLAQLVTDISLLLLARRAHL